MEVTVVSVEKVKPSCLATTNHHHHQLMKPFKLSLLDQLTSRSYFGIILFYPPNNNGTNIASKLKASLATALNSNFYPLAGREKGNATVDDFQAGVLFIEATVKGYAAVSEFLQRPDLEHLNKLFPVEPFCLIALTHDDHPPLPSLLVQVNTFDCGGVAVGLSFYHKVADAATADAFLKTWVAAAHQNQDHDDGEMIVLSQAGSSVFPPREPIFASELERLGDKMFLDDKGRRTATRRFVFETRSVALLKSRIAATATGGAMENPTTTEAVSAFIWESVMRATAADVTVDDATATVRVPPRFHMQSVNLRRRMNIKDQPPLLSDSSFGNLLAGATATCDPHDITTTTVGDLARLIRAGVARVDGEFVETWSGEVLAKGMERVGEMKQRGEMLTFSSWIGFGFADVDFGWGRPAWTGVFGDASGDYPLVGNFIVLVKGLGLQGEKNIEAWIRLDENVMAALEKDPNFLQFASLNPSVLL